MIYNRQAVQDYLNQDIAACNKWIKEPFASPGNKIQTIFSVIEGGGTYRAAAGASRISQERIFSWKKGEIPESVLEGLSDEEQAIAKSEFSECLTLAESKAESAFTKTIKAAADGGSVRAAAFWLERRRTEDYKRQDSLTVRDDDELSELRKMFNEMDPYADTSNQSTGTERPEAGSDSPSQEAS